MKAPQPLFQHAPAVGIGAWGVKARAWAPGLILSMTVGLVSMLLGRIDALADRGISPLVIAIVLGMVLGNSVYPRLGPACDAGVGVSKQNLLRAGIVLYGLRLTLQDIGHIGWAGVLADAAVLCSTFALAQWIGVRWLGLERKTAILIGAGSSICGAAAVLATAPVARARADQVTVAVATVVVFGTTAVAIYPLLHAWALPWFADADQAGRFFGLYIGSTVHEVAQVVAAGQTIAPAVAQDAVIAKLVRVLMLAPFLVVLSGWLLRDTSHGHPHGSSLGPQDTANRASRIVIPWFAVAFMAVVAANSVVMLPAAASHALEQLDTLLLSTAMAALGLTTHHSAIRRAGVKPLLLAGLLFAWLIVGGAAINGVALTLLGR